MKTKIILPLLFAFLVGCAKPTSHGEGEAASSDHNQVSLPNTAAALIPLKTELETIILGLSRVPLRYNGEPFSLQVIANNPAATFECREEPQREFSPCAADRELHWDNLIHGRGVTVEIRAHTQDQVDDTPARVSFMVDRIAGEGLDSASETSPLLFDPSYGLPIADAPQDSDDSVVSRTLPVGKFAAVVTPPQLRVTSYSTTQTVSASLQVMFDPELSVFSSRCNHSWEVQQEVAGQSLCLATPTPEQFAQTYGDRRPLEHVELQLPPSHYANEALVIAAFDLGPQQLPDIDKTPTGFSCDGASMSNSLWLEGWKGFFDFSGKHSRLRMEYCLRQEGTATTYLARVVVPLQTNESPPVETPVTGPFLVVWYRVNGAAGVYSWNQLQARLGDYLNQSLIATVPL